MGRTVDTVNIVDVNESDYVSIYDTLLRRYLSREIYWVTLERASMQGIGRRCLRLFSLKLVVDCTMHLDLIFLSTCCVIKIRFQLSSDVD